MRWILHHSDSKSQKNLLWSVWYFRKFNELTISAFFSTLQLKSGFLRSNQNVLNKLCEVELLRVTNTHTHARSYTNMHTKLKQLPIKKNTSKKNLRSNINSFTSLIKFFFSSQLASRFLFFSVQFLVFTRKIEFNNREKELNWIFRNISITLWACSACNVLAFDYYYCFSYCTSFTLVQF